MLSVGVDPDLHNTGIAYVKFDDVEDFSTARVVYVGIAKVPARIKGERAALLSVEALQTLNLPADTPDRVVIELMQYYGGGFAKNKKRVDPADLINISIVTGGASSIFMSRSSGETKMAAPVPRIWKKQVPKPIHHARILRFLGLPFEESKWGPQPKWDAGTVFSGPISATQTNHVLDAVGLAIWGANPEFQKTCVKV